MNNALRNLPALLAALLLVATGATGVAAGDADLPLSANAHAKAKAGGDHRVDVIVQFQRGASAADRGNASAMGELKRQYKKLDMVALSVPQGRLNALARQPGVKFVTLDEAVSGASDSARKTADTPPIGSTYDNLYHGNGNKIAIIDSGVGSHPDIPLALQVDFVDDGQYNYAYDPQGHGTHIAGIAVGMGAASNFAHWGQAYMANIVSLRALNSYGAGSESDVIAALDWLLVNGSTHNVRVVNLSLGKGVNVAAANDPLVQAVEAVWDAGMVVVVSAGNYGWSGNGTITSPGISRKVITVGSLTDAGTGTDFTDDTVSSYSSRGPTRFDHVVKPDLLAPGNRIGAAISAEASLKSLLPWRKLPCPSSYGGTDVALENCQADYFEMSGTSMAAGMVSGAAIRMIGRDPSLNPATVKARLMKSARKISGDITDVGAGVLDVYAALDATGTTNSALSPVAMQSSDGSGIFIEDTSQLWGGSEWSAAFLFSDGFVFADGFVFSDVFVFSDTFPFADAFIFSDVSIWADASIWSDAFIFSDTFVFADRVNSMSQADLNGDLGDSPIVAAPPER